MHGLTSFDDNDDGTVFRDLIMLALLGFVVVVVLLLPHLNPPAKAVASVEPPGNVVIEIRWPDPIDADVDLWVQAPGDVPVGYSNKGGRVFNLLRDDLGHRDKADTLNYEVAYSRGMPAGEYAVNLHFYSSRALDAPIPVEVTVSLKRNPQDSSVRIASRKIVLQRRGEEVTAFRFSLADDGTLIKDSIHDLPKPLRNAKR